MATLDQLSAEQRAIVELVVQRGRSYDALADVLQVPSSRVQELARDALVELSPVTARRVERDWRGQVADYILGQQSNSESRETREHLKDSEAARTWALSLLDSLDTLYGENDNRPRVPEPSSNETVERSRPRGEATRASTLEERVRERERAREGTRPRKAERERDDKDRDRARGKAEDRDGKATVKRDGALSPAAEAALRRRRLMGAVGAVALAAVIVGILAIAGVFSGDDKKSSSSSSSSGSSDTASGDGDQAAQGQPQVLGQVELKPQNGAKAQGLAYLVRVGSKPYLVVQAKLPPLLSNQQKFAYEVWLYNSKDDAKSVGAQYTDDQGNYQGRQELPADFAKKYKFIDITKEPFDKDTGNSGNSLLRGAFADLQPVPQQGEGGGGQGGGGAGGGSGNGNGG